jgi:hypothetical protein
MKTNQLDQIFGPSLPVHPSMLPQRNYTGLIIAGVFVVSITAVSVYFYIEHQKRIRQEGLRMAG